MSAHLILNGYGYFGSKTVNVVREPYLINLEDKQYFPEIFNIFGIIEPDSKRRSDARKQFPNAQVVSDFNDIKLKKSGKEIFILKDSSPPLNRIPILDWANENSIFVLLEKPLGWNKEMLSWYEGYNYSVNFQEVFNPVIKWLKNYLDYNGILIRRIQFFRMNVLHSERILGLSSRHGVLGGSLIDKMIHDCHLLLEVLFNKYELNGFQLFDSDIRLAPHSKRDLIKFNSNFLKIDGEKWHDKNSILDISDLAMSILSEFNFGKSNVEVLFQSSWAGFPDYFENLKKVPKNIFQKALMDFNIDGFEKEIELKYALKKRNIKYVYIEGKSSSGDDITIFANLQKRAYVKPFVFIKNKKHENYVELPWELPLLNSLAAFYEWTIKKRKLYLDKNNIIYAHKLLIDLREKALKNFNFDSMKEADKFRKTFAFDNQLVLSKN